MHFLNIIDQMAVDVECCHGGWEPDLLT